MPRHAFKKMHAKQIAVILGATAGQGRSVVDTLLRNDLFAVRAVTRNCNSKEAQILKSQGVEVVEANLDNPSSLFAAFENAHVIFAVTRMVNGDMAGETRHGRNIATVAATIPTLQHFIWSTLPSALSKGFSVPHQDAKAEVDEYILSSLPELAVKTTFFWGGMYAENIRYPSFVPNRVKSSGKHVWIQPVGPKTILPLVGDHRVNVGLIVERILANPSQCLPRRYVRGVTDWIENGEFLNLWTEAIGRKTGRDIGAVYIPTEIDAVEQLWPGMGGEWGVMLKFLERSGRAAWDKEGIEVLAIEDLGLEAGCNGLVSTRRYIEEAVTVYI